MWLLTSSIFLWTAGILTLNLISTSQSASLRRRTERTANSFWKRSNQPLNQHDPINFKFALAQSHVEDVHQVVMKISDPNSPDYGKLWTPQQIADYFAPSSDAIQAVTDWLVKSGVGPSDIMMSQSKGFLETKLTIGHAEKLMKADYNQYQHIHTGDLTIATTAYELPDYIAKHIDFVSPGNALAPRLRFGNTTLNVKKIGSHIVPTVSKTAELSVAAVPDSSGLLSKLPSGPESNLTSPGGTSNNKSMPQRVGDSHQKHANQGNSSIIGGHQRKNATDSRKPDATPFNTSVPCGNQMSPECLKHLYKFNGYVQKAADKNSLGVIEVTPQTALLDDFDPFFKKFAPDVVGSRPEVVSIDGGKLNNGLRMTEFVSESNLDLQYAMALSHPLKVQLLQIGDPDQEAGLNNFLDAVDAAHCKVPLNDGIDGIYPNPKGYNKRDCGTVKSPYVVSLSYGHNEIEAPADFLLRQCQEFAKLGMMGVTLLSASGDHGVGGHYDVCMTDSGKEDHDGTVFNPTWPSTCPYITSVGATQLPRGASIAEPESACYEHTSSGGGFSNVFGVPTYQKAALENYFENFEPPYSAKQYNTSRRSRGYPDLSANGAAFLPVINGEFSVTYGTSASTPTVAAILTMINDARLSLQKSPIGFINTAIYSDYFRGAFTDIINGTNPGCHTDGFKAVKGWDPLTGLGTLDFSKLLPLWTALP